MIPLTLVTGADAFLRESRIAAALDAGVRTAVILEGLPTGATPFDEVLPSWLTIVRVAPGCICCTGSLTMRVTLNRLLRQHPERLYISLADSSHLQQIRQFLQQEPYDKWLGLTKELTLDSRSTE
ncbi:GTPase [Janthinobacterium sp. 17J80-10]|nr:GTPase [Janthinobacterium sp. 17J80-10]QAU33155.1 GTPase [Janthinobacterium sp. 17J80-10]